MSTQSQPSTEKRDARAKLLAAALRVVRAKGYSATSIDDLCREAGVTKGAFFHHFASKSALAVAAAAHWSDTTGALFDGAPFHAHADPLDRVLGYIDFRMTLLTGDVADFTCLVGTMVQEVFDADPEIRAACDASISDHARKLEADIAGAMGTCKIEAGWTAESLALHAQAVLQGAFILAKAKGGPEVAADSIAHLRRYVEFLFHRPSKKERPQ